MLNSNISVVVPAYNATNTIVHLLNSIPSNVKVIVVDDRSSDSEKLKTLLKDYVNVDYYINNHNLKGAGTCRNIALNKVITEWVVFADADDYFCVDAFDTMNGISTSCVDEDIIFFKPTSVYVETNVISDRHIYLEKLISKNNEEIRYKFFVPWSKMYRTSFLREFSIRFDEVIASNDVMFSTKSGHFARKVKVVDKVIYTVTRGKNTLTVNTSKDVKKSRYNVVLNYNCFLHSVCKNKYQIPLVTVIIKYRDVLGCSMILKLVKFSILQRWPIIPQFKSIRQYFTYNSKNDSRYKK